MRRAALGWATALAVFGACQELGDPGPDTGSVDEGGGEGGFAGATGTADGGTESDGGNPGGISGAASGGATGGSAGGAGSAGEGGIDGDAGAGASMPGGGTAGAAGSAPSGGAAGEGAGGMDDRDPPGTVAVAFQITPAHSGAQPGDRLKLPLQPRWSHDFGESGISYPLIADDRVVVTIGTRLFALDAGTGNVAWGPIELGGRERWSNAAYDRGRVFAANVEGTLSAFDMRTGARAWQVTLPGNYSVYSAPTALNGRVYTSRTNGTLYAIDANDGAILWSALVENGWQSSPTLSSSNVHACYLCNNTYAFDAVSGARLWYHRGNCTGGGGGTTAIFAGGRLYTRGPEANWIFDAVSGETLGLLPSGPAPAVSDDIVYAVNDGVLFASGAEDQRPLWQFGDGSLVSAPIVVGSHVVVGAVAGELFALDRETGRQVSAVRLASPVAPSNEQRRDQPLTGLGAANDLLVVPAGGLLVAY